MIEIFFLGIFTHLSPGHLDFSLIGDYLDKFWLTSLEHISPEMQLYITVSSSLECVTESHTVDLRANSFENSISTTVSSYNIHERSGK